MTQLFAITAFVVAADKRVATKSVNLTVLAESPEAADAAFRASEAFGVVTHATPAVAVPGVITVGTFADLGRGAKLPENTVELRPAVPKEPTEKVVKVEKLDQSTWRVEDAVMVSLELSEEFAGFVVLDEKDKKHPFAGKEDAIKFAARVAHRIAKAKAEAAASQPKAEEVPADAPF